MLGKIHGLFEKMGLSKALGWLITTLLMAILAHHAYLLGIYQDVAEQVLDKTENLPSGTIKNYIENGAASDKPG